MPFLLGVVVGALVAASAVASLLATGVLDDSSLRVSLGPRLEAWRGSALSDRRAVLRTSGDVSAAGTIYLETSRVRIVYAHDGRNPFAFTTGPLVAADGRDASDASGPLHDAGPPAKVVRPSNQEGLITMQTSRVTAIVRARATWSGFLTTANVRRGPWEQPLAKVAGPWRLVTRSGAGRRGIAGTLARLPLRPFQPYALSSRGHAPVVVSVNQAAVLLIGDGTEGRSITARLVVRNPRRPLRTYIGIDTGAGVEALFNESTYVASRL
jgi:hypothetical protein